MRSGKCRQHRCLRQPFGLEPACLLAVVVRPGPVVVLDAVVGTGTLAHGRGLGGSGDRPVGDPVNWIRSLVIEISVPTTK